MGRGFTDRLEVRRCRFGAVGDSVRRRRAERGPTRTMKYHLEFEKPIAELQRKLEDLRQHPDTHSLGISFEEEIRLLESKLEEVRRQVYSNLTPWQRVQLARHPKRPYTLDYIQHAFTDFEELHGDRLFGDDRAVVGGFAMLGGDGWWSSAPRRGGTRRRTS